jgi:hypothetical protein
MNPKTPTNKAYVLAYPIKSYDIYTDYIKNEIDYDLESNKLLEFQVPQEILKNASTYLNQAVLKYETLFKNKNGIYEFTELKNKSLTKTLDNLKNNKDIELIRIG